MSYLIIMLINYIKINTYLQIRIEEAGQDTDV